MVSLLTLPILLFFHDKLTAAFNVGRRQAIHSAAASVVIGSPMMPASANSPLATNLLESRVSREVLSPPPYGMDGNDVYYPEWFLGTWSVQSTCTEVLAPCGVMLFGGNATYDRARAELSTPPLRYESRFIRSSDTVIADRAFNVNSIATATLGANSVVNVALSNPNQLSCVLALGGESGVVQVDLLTLNRCQEVQDATHFDCSEVVQEIVADTSRRPRLLKQVETTSLYTVNEKQDAVSCRQRSATFLLPSQQDPVALQLWKATRGRPVDMRFYDVAYRKR